MINFLKRMTFALMLLTGIISLNVTATEDDRVIVYKPQLDKNYVTVCGQLPVDCGGQVVSIQIIKPNGTIGVLSDVFYMGEAMATEDGSFEHLVNISNLRTYSEYEGTYTVFAGTENALPSELTEDLNGEYVQSFEICYPEKIFNVKAYGATGNGDVNLTDDAGVQKAVSAAAGGGTIYFPKGHYVLSQTLSLPDNIIIAGAKDARIEMTQSNLAIFDVQGKKNITIEGLIFSGTGSGVCIYDGAENVKFKENTVENMSLIVPLNSESSIKQLVIDGNVLSGSLGYGIALINVDGASVTNNTITGYATAIKLKTVSNTSVKGNHLCSGGIAAYNGSLSIESNTVRGAKTGILLSGISNVVVGNNIIYDITEQGIHIYGNSKNVVLRSNNLCSGSDGNVLLQITSSGMINIDGNAFLFSIGADGVNLIGSGTGKVVLETVKDIRFSGNYLNNVGVFGSVCGSALISQNNIVLENNISAEFTALNITGKDSYTLLDVEGNNMVRNIKTDGVTAKGIQLSLSGGANVADVSNNSIKGFDVGMFLSTAEHSGVLPVYKLGRNSFSDLDVAIMAETDNYAVVRTDKNLNGDMDYLDLSQTGIQVKNGTLLFPKASTESGSAGKIYIDNEWYSFGSLNEPKKLEITVNEVNIEAGYSALNMSQNTIMVISIYDEAGAMLDTVSTTDKADNSMHNSIPVPSDGYMAKVFVWEETSIKPVYYCKKILLK